MNKKIIIGNWKMNKDLLEGKLFIKDFNKLLKKNQISTKTQFGIAPSFLNLELISKKLLSCNFIVAQNIHFKLKGAHTGEISAQMIKSIGANSVILGHSERRQQFNETNEIINQKTKLALANNLTPIVCVGETMAMFNSGKSKQMIKKSLLNSLKNIKDFSKIIVAYEPIWAIGTGKSATSKYANDMAKYIKSLTSKDLRVQYGGSINPQNIKEFMQQKNIDGALVGGASLNPKTFIQLLVWDKTLK